MRFLLLRQAFRQANRGDPKEDLMIQARATSTLTAAWLVALLAGCAMMNMTPIPDSLKAPPTQLLALETHAKGVQIYECRASKDNPARFEWVFVAPEAELFDTAGIKVGKHYAGPTWEAIDGSKVVGEVKAHDDGPDANAIPWLMLSAKSTSGSGMLARTVTIQRVRTVGGKAPADCGPAQAGKEARVAYEATYNFYVAKP
jgi:hypothetical protein